MPGKFHFGWQRQAFDARDRKLFVSNKTIAALTPFVDLALFSQVPQLDQGGEGSCGPNTADEEICFDQLAEGLALVPPSRLFIYYNTRKIMGTIGQDSGVDNRSMLKALSQHGFCPESMWPYDDTQATMVKEPTPACYASAIANCITNYAAVPVLIDQMKGTLFGGFPFIFGFDVFQSMLSDAVALTGIVPDPGAGESPVGGHDVSLCGYTDVARPGVLPGNVWPAGTFKFRNHWRNADGTAWGDGGHGYISYAYAGNPNHASDFWVVNAIPSGSVVPPVPPPAPANVLFSFGVRTAGKVGQIVKLRLPVPVPAGEYDVVPHAASREQVILEAEPVEG